MNIPAFVVSGSALLIAGFALHAGFLSGVGMAMIVLAVFAAVLSQ